MAYPHDAIISAKRLTYELSDGRRLLDDITCGFGRERTGLSGGERMRAALACALNALRPSTLVLLDEPTNYLDLENLEAVETIVAGYDGALLVVSHDATFLESIGVDETIELGGG